MADVNTATGAKVFIGPAMPAAGAVVADFSALTYVEVGLVESFGDFGSSASEVNFNSLGDGYVRKSKGIRNNGNITLTVGADASDPGQQALASAETQNLKYAVKLVYNDKLTTGGTGSIEYFRCLVMSNQRTGGTSDAILRRVFNLGIDGKLFEVAAT
jgi:hypothetical protein